MKRILALILALLLPLTGCAHRDRIPSGPTPSAAYQRYQTEFLDVFDTYTVFSAYTRGREEFDRYADIIHGEMLRLHRLYDIYNDYPGVANLKTVNDNAGGQAVAVDPAILDLLELCRQAYEETGGVVNVAMGPVLRLWHRQREAALADPEDAAPPALAALEAANEHTDIEQMVLDRAASTVRLLDPEMSLDVGAVAKGYGAQRAIDLAREAGLVSGILSAGGNVCAVGAPMDGRESWTVGVQDPEPGSAQLIDTLALADASAVTSGDYQRYFLAGDRLYHHIIDPETLYPAGQCRAVTVVHPDSGWADILSTAAFILPQAQAEALIQRHGAEAVWLAEDGSFTATDGYRVRSERFGGS